MRGTPVVLVLALARLGGIAEANDAPSYVGPAACSSNNCHGSVTPRLDSERSLQNEYVTWYKSDRHAKAYDSLLTERGLRIARLLGMVQGPATAASWLENARQPERCLDCHALKLPGEPKLKPGDGVSCEACHGPAGPWLTQHTERGWEPAKSIALGMRETMDPGKAADICLGCHFGTATRTVDHEMLAAGHPSLVFELDAFSANMPVHWRENSSNRRWFRGGAWAAGQAVALRESAQRMARDARERAWLDFSVYECSSCHHDLRQPSWRQERGYPGRRPGTPPLDTSQQALFALLARAVAPAESGRVAENVLERIRATSLDEETVRGLQHAIVDQAEPLAFAGFRTAQQTAWALDALAVARQGLLSGREDDQDPLRLRIGALFGLLRDAAAYDPARFAAAVRALRPALPSGGAAR